MKQKEISVTHINVRQSISFLLIKLIIIEFLNTVSLLLLYFPMFQNMRFFSLLQVPVEVSMLFFLIHIIIKTYISFLVIFQWLNEYYEISPEKIIHKSGFIFRKEEHYSLIHISSIGLQQTFFGKLLNYGTVELYDRFDKKHKYLYLIHNPMRYYRIVESLLPSMDQNQSKIREHLFEEEN